MCFSFVVFTGARAAVGFAFWLLEIFLLDLDNRLAYSDVNVTPKFLLFSSYCSLFWIFHVEGFGREVVAGIYHLAWVPTVHLPVRAAWCLLSSVHWRWLEVMTKRFTICLPRLFGWSLFHLTSVLCFQFEPKGALYYDYGVQRICCICCTNLSHTCEFFILLKYLEFSDGEYLQVQKNNFLSNMRQCNSYILENYTEDFSSCIWSSIYLLKNWLQIRESR